MSWLERCDERNQLITDEQRAPDAEAAYRAMVRRRGDRAPWDVPAILLPVVGCFAFVLAFLRDRRDRRRH
ncbi:MAG: hypothetical protein AAFZ07_27860 [Actinomycetota bacterium]